MASRRLFRADRPEVMCATSVTRPPPGECLLSVVVCFLSRLRPCSARFFSSSRSVVLFFRSFLLRSRLSLCLLVRFCLLVSVVLVVVSVSVTGISYIVLYWQSHNVRLLCTAHSF